MTDPFEYSQTQFDYCPTWKEGNIISSPQSSLLSSAPSSDVTSVSKSACTFTIPNQWRPDTQSCIDTKTLTATARNDICRTLVTLLTVNYGTYERSHIREAAHKLVSKYPFMADDLGDGLVSIILYYNYLGFLFRNHGNVK